MKVVYIAGLRVVNKDKVNVDAAKQICKACGGTAVLLFVIDDRTGDVASASYGIDKPRCAAAGNALDQIGAAIAKGRLIVTP